MKKVTTTIDGQELTEKEAFKMLEDENIIVKKLSVTVGKPESDGESELSNEGFEIEKEYIASMSESMDQYGASRIVLSLTNSRKIMGRNLYIIMADTDDEINEILEKLK